jgi:hypothetical protein
VKAKVVKGQKGTIGLTYSQEDMPFTKDGIIPDIIMNPNAIPKRMTIAQLIECVFGKVGTIAGSELDATPFRKVNVEDITEIMEKMGYHGAGTEILYNGKTGEQITAAIFMGPTFYYRLKHLVEDKQHCIDYETEILTKNGWKNHNSLAMNDEIATLKDGYLEYDYPLEIFDYPNHVGNMYYIKNDNIDMFVTGEHRMWASHDGQHFEFIKAKDILGKNVTYKNDALFDTNDESKKMLEKYFSGENSIETDSYYFTGKLQKLAIESGLYINVECNSDIYKCTIVKDKVNLWNTNKETIEEYTENVSVPVWCVHVPSEVFLIRRNGKVCWTGNSRATGPYQLLTMQPAEGRSRDGGFRFGEMERDAMLSHGAVQFLKERTFDSSDKYFVWIDNETGMISPVNPDKGIYKSLYSDNTTKFSKVQIPYSSKLLIQELQSMHINPRLLIGKK